LGDALQLQAMPQLDRRSHDVGAARFPSHPRDEGLVDLDLMDREPMQVGERGVAGAEVIDRKAHPELAELGQGLDGTLGLGHDQALRDLEHKQGWRGLRGLDYCVVQRTILVDVEGRYTDITVRT